MKRSKKEKKKKKKKKRKKKKKKKKKKKRGKLGLKIGGPRKWHVAIKRDLWHTRSRQDKNYKICTLLSEKIRIWESKTLFQLGGFQLYDI